MMLLAPARPISVNNRCKKTTFDDSLFGFCLIRVLNNIHALKIKHSTTQILINKTDFNAPNRRLHVMMRFVLMCITITDRITHLLARLPFGSTPAADEFCTVSEAVYNGSSMIRFGIRRY